jgi:ligand-binding SRPBCC domain-containing protein
LTNDRPLPEERAALDLLRTAQVVQRSRLAASHEHVWERIVTMDGVNAELMPIVRMTFPAGWERLDRGGIHGRTPLFRSTLKLLGVLPIDRHSLALIMLKKGCGFLEHSSSLIHRDWIHERTLAAVSGGTEITDRVYFRSRVPGLGLALGPVMRFVFRHRHRRLRSYFGAWASPY